ncbi:hypothetical protein P7C70_g1844, partial [Phenoliferia sp. Uapishka_3]
MRRALSLFIEHTFSPELAYAAFAAYRLEAKVNRNIQETHFVALRFKYDCSQQSNRRQFILEKAELMHIDEVRRIVAKTKHPFPWELSQAEIQKEHPELFEPIGMNPERVVVPIYIWVRDQTHGYIEIEWKLLAYSLPRKKTDGIGEELYYAVEESMSNGWEEVLIRSSNIGPPPTSFGDLYDRTLRERFPQYNIPLRFDTNLTFHTLSSEELEITTGGQDTKITENTDWKAHMMDTRRLLGSGGVLNLRMTDSVCAVISAPVAGFVDLNDVALRRAKKKATKQGKSGESAG